MAKVTSQRPFVISAVLTPLHEDDSLHVEGLEAHLAEQWQAGINGLLVAGTMGLMQLLTDRTYANLIEHALRISAGRGEIMVGVGDTSLARTRERIELLNRYPVDGVVVVTPYLIKFPPEELVGYYRALADASRHPLYLYDLPTLTGVKLEFETVERVADHPNIVGIKASCEAAWTKELIRRMGDRFRIIIAQPTIVDALLREGISEHLDGLFAVAPVWTMSLVRAAQAGDWDRASEYQRRLIRLLELIKPEGVFPGVTAILNARGISGKFSPAPMTPQLDADARRKLFDEPVIQELIGGKA
jgi:4-hydroxy-tetrahydrodipicolinate synthase